MFYSTRFIYQLQLLVNLQIKILDWKNVINLLGMMNFYRKHEIWMCYCYCEYSKHHENIITLVEAFIFWYLKYI